MTTVGTGANRRIAFLLSSLKFGGGERVALNLAHALKARGWAIDFVLMSYEGDLLAEAEAHFTVVDLRCARTWQLPVLLAGYLRRMRPAGLISSFWKLNLCAALARVAAPRTRLVLWEHSPPSRSVNSPTAAYAVTASIVYRLATRVVAVSEGVAADVRRITIGLGSRVRRIYNPIPGPTVDSGGAKSANTIVWIGRFADPKNPALMLDAFARLPADGPYLLKMVGAGPMRDMLEQRTDDLGLRDRVEFTGFRSDIYAILADAQVLAVTSDREGLPSVMIEALNAGCGIVATDCGEGIHEILDHGRYGSVVAVGDAGGVADAICKEAAAPRDPAVQRSGADRFSPDVIAQQFLAALDLR